MPAVPKKAKSATAAYEDLDPEVRRAFEWLRREADKAEKGSLPRPKEGSNAARAIAVLAGARITLDHLHAEASALSTLAALLSPCYSRHTRASVLGVLVRASVDTQGTCTNTEREPFKRTPSGALQLAQRQKLLGVTYSAIANVLDFANTVGGGDAFALLADLLRANEETQAEAVRCDVVALATRKMAAGDDPGGQSAAAACVSLIGTSQGLKLLLDYKTLNAACRMLRSHDEAVKIAAISAFDLFATRLELQAELNRLGVLASLLRLMYEPCHAVLTATLRTIPAFLKSGDKTEASAARLRDYAALLEKKRVVEGVLVLGIKGAQHPELNLVCINFITASLKLLVQDAPKVSDNAVAKVEKTKEDVLDRKSRRGLNALTQPGAPAPATPQAAFGDAKGNVTAASSTSSKPLVAQLVNCKELFAEWFACLFSTSSRQVHQAAIELMGLSVDRKRDFVTAFVTPSVLWALISVCARDERDDSTREPALKRLVDNVRLTKGSGSVLYNKIVKELATRFVIQLTPPEEHVVQVANANKRSLQLDLENVCKMLLNKSVDTVVQIEALVWIRCMIRADPTARRILAASGAYLQAVLKILQGDVNTFPLAYKAHSLRVLADTLYDMPNSSPWTILHPSIIFRSEYADAPPQKHFEYVAEYFLRVFNEEAEKKAAEDAVSQNDGDGISMTSGMKESEAKKDAEDLLTQDLLTGLVYVLIGMARSDLGLQIRASRLGLCNKALDMMVKFSAPAMRQLGANLLTVMCENAPSLSRLILSIGLPCEFIENSKSTRSSPPPVLQTIFDVLKQTEPAPPPQIDTAGLDKLSGTARQKKVQDFEKFTARAQMEELKRLAELEPLVVSSLQTLLVLCGADNVQEAAGAFHGHWNSLRMPLSFVQSNLRLRCWSDRTIFDVMVKLAQHSNPTIAQLVLNPCSSQARRRLAGLASMQAEPHPRCAAIFLSCLVTNSFCVRVAVALACDRSSR
jgi:hypothetical protein